MKNYTDDFLRLSYPDSKPERNASRKRQLQKIFSWLPHMPMCTIKAKDIATLVREKNITAENVTLCRLFWEYLLSHDKCTGRNPFPSQDLRIPSTDVLNRKAFTPEEIDPPVFAKLLSLIFRKKTGVNCAVALLASGFDMFQVTSLRWKDIEFIDNYSDFAIVHIQRDKTATSKHDYSRPAIPAVSKYLKAAYNEKCQTVGPEKIACMKVAADLIDGRPKSAESEEIANEVHNLLVRAGYTGKISKSGRPTTEEHIPFAILKKNYQRLLLSVAGLNDDADAFNFLAGKQMESSTFINYESHICPEAQYRFYTILKTLSPEKKLNSEKPLREEKSSLVFKAVPATTHEAVQITGKISLRAGDTIVISVPHGVTGWIEAK